MQPLHWIEQESTDVPAGYDWLTTRERRGLEKLRFTRRRSDWRLGRWTAKLAVAACLEDGTAPDDVEILAASDGAPEVTVSGGVSPLRLSISHSGGRSICVVAPLTVLVGCDVETVAERGEMFSSDYFTRSEADLVREVRGDQRTLVETLLWSGKESALKALRDGLRRDTRDVIVQMEPGWQTREWNPIAVSLADGSTDLFGWWRYSEGRVYTAVTCHPCTAPQELELGAMVAR